MQVNVSIGQNHHFALREALLIYRSTEHQNGRSAGPHAARSDGSVRCSR